MQQKPGAILLILLAFLIVTVTKAQYLKLFHAEGKYPAGTVLLLQDETENKSAIKLLNRQGFDVAALGQTSLMNAIQAYRAMAAKKGSGRLDIAGIGTGGLLPARLAQRLGAEVNAKLGMTAELIRK